MNYFLSCDWGTSSFRLRLAETTGGSIVGEERSNEGIADTFSQWLERGDPDEDRRRLFYLNIIQKHIRNLELKVNHSLAGTKLIISGMASSTIGCMPIPYSSLPLATDGSGFNTAFITASEDFEHDVLIISGVKTDDNVMRGEETQLIGCIASPNVIINNQLFIFPGTHSKHIQVNNNQIAGIKTYMTGEFFQLLSQQSILKNDVEPPVEPGAGDMGSFKKGLRDAMSASLLHSVFKVRVNQLFNRLNKTENYNYLSGLLIGAELQDLRSLNFDTINLICASNLEPYYSTALGETGVKCAVNIFAPAAVDQATVKGQLKIGKQLKILV